MWGKGDTFALLVGMQIGAATVEGSMELSQKIKNGTAYGNSDSIIGNLSEETWNSNLKHYEHFYVHWNIIYNHQDLKATQVSISRWVDKTSVEHLHNRILLSHKEEKYFTFCDCMDEPGEYYAKWNKPVRERQIPHDFMHR